MVCTSRVKSRRGTSLGLGSAGQSTITALRPATTPAALPSLTHCCCHFALGPLPRYALSYIECVQGIKKGDTVMQIGVGSGIKCGVLVWKVSSGDVHVQQELCYTAEAFLQVFSRFFPCTAPHSSPSPAHRTLFTTSACLTPALSLPMAAAAAAACRHCTQPTMWFSNASPRLLLPLSPCPHPALNLPAAAARRRCAPSTTSTRPGCTAPQSSACTSWRPALTHPKPRALAASLPCCCTPSSPCCCWLWRASWAPCT